MTLSKLNFNGRTLNFGKAPVVVGVLNVTPDSYFDGGKYTEPNVLATHVRAMIEHGAGIIEIGGESTGPGSVDVRLDEELARVLPAIDIVRTVAPDAWIGVDTWKADVAAQALKRGADIINDVTAGRMDPKMLSVVAKAGCPYVMMHAKDSTPRTVREDRTYDDVVEAVHQFLAERRSLALKAGIDAANIIVDPGLGHFVSAIASYSFALLASLESFFDLGPVLVSPSRKSFLAGPQNLPPKDRLPATLAATTVAVLHGASFIRTHDVQETVRTCEAAITFRKLAPQR